MIDLKNPIYSDETKAREHLEALQWPNGPVCPFCGVGSERIAKLQGKSTRPGVHKCRDCRKPFSVTVGTVFERSHVPLTKWLLATHLLCSSKKGISSHQLKRTLGVDFKTAWFMSHRIREAMAPGSSSEPMGGEGKIVEADETFWGNAEGEKKRPGYAHKMTVFTLIERGGKARSTQMKRANAYDIKSTIYEHVDPKSTLHTDGAQYYKGAPVAKHESVDHSAKEYVRGNVHVNTTEAFFQVFKRGMTGIYQHCSEKHLHRYLSEFDFRYNNRIALEVDDTMRAAKALQGIEGKRLTYRRIGRQ